MAAISIINTNNQTGVVNCELPLLYFFG